MSSVQETFKSAVCVPVLGSPCVGGWCWISLSRMCRGLIVCSAIQSSLTDLDLAVVRVV